MSRRRVFTILVVLTLFISAGWVDRPLDSDKRRECPWNGATRADGTKFDPGTEDRPSKYPVKVIDFTDQGELADRCQWSDFLLEFRNTKKPVFVVIYVHGWKHDGNTEDQDLKHFTALIENIQRQFRHERHVIGGFLAWPGLAGLTPIGKNLSFWNRKTAADRVSISGNVTKLLAAVNSVRCWRNQPQDMVVAIGHSFGARILFSSVSSSMLHDSQMKHPGSVGGIYGRISAASDLTILVNPAFEASRYTAVDDIRRPLETFDLLQQPVLLIVSTSGDYATRFAFPAGQIVSGRWHERERSTVGNHPRFYTHVLSHSTVHGPHPSWWYDKFCHNGLCLERRASDGERLNPGNPFIVALTDQSIIKNHSEIWNDAFIAWMGGFVVQSEKGLVVDGTRQGSCFNNSDKARHVEPHPDLGLDWTTIDDVSSQSKEKSPQQ